MTNAAGTPFSFFRYIFWNEAIDLNTQAGQQILQHELTHVNQKHSIDKLLIQLVLVVGWFNPFFWLLKKEMNMIHEFISDQKAVGKGNTASLATMLLTAAYPQQQFALTNPFFFSPIKRRLQMLTLNKNCRFTYLRRLMVLPILVIVTVLIAFRTASSSTIHTRLDKVYTVVIDAGHGGADNGALALDGTTEKQINLQLANLVQSMNTHPNIKIKLTRENDAFQTVQDKASLANSMHPDLFISLHCNAAVSNQTDQGIELYLPGTDKPGYAHNYAFANTMANSFIAAKHAVRGVLSRNQRMYVLQNVTCPAVLIEAGFLTNAAELKKLKDKRYQEELAIAILNGIQQYLSLQEKKTTSLINPIKGAQVDKMHSLPKQRNTLNTSGTRTSFSKMHTENEVINNAITNNQTVIDTLQQQQTNPVNTSLPPRPPNSFLIADSAGNVSWITLPKEVGMLKMNNLSIFTQTILLPKKPVHTHK